MKIAVDCRYLGKSGIGRVCQGILDNLDYSQNKFYLIGDKSKLQKYQNAEIIEDYSEPYSVKGFLCFNKKFINGECNALIIPNFLIPLGIKIPVYTVIHDLIFLDMDVSTRGAADKFIKKFLLTRCAKKSKKIACVSKFTKSRVEYHFKKYSHKCYVNYIGLSQSVLDYRSPEDFIKSKNTLVFVGNVKPHKGLKTLIDAYRKLPDNKYELKIIGKKDNFLTNLNFNEVDFQGVEFTGELDDYQLLNEISSATFLVQPSQYEGFGLPPLEALYLGTKPIISDIDVFKEVYGDLPVEFFGDADNLAEKILTSSSSCPNVKNIICQKYSYKKFTSNFISEVLR